MLKSDDLLVFNCDRPDVWQILDCYVVFAKRYNYGRNNCDTWSIERPHLFDKD